MKNLEKTTRQRLLHLLGDDKGQATRKPSSLKEEKMSIGTSSRGAISRTKGYQHFERKIKLMLRGVKVSLTRSRTSARCMGKKLLFRIWTADVACGVLLYSKIYLKIMFNFQCEMPKIPNNQSTAIYRC